MSPPAVGTVEGTSMTPAGTVSRSEDFQRGVMILKKGTIKRIHVNQHMIRADRKAGTVSDVVSVATSSGVFHGKLVSINGSSRIVYSPKKPRPCGARLWIETRAEIELEDV